MRNRSFSLTDVFGNHHLEGVRVALVIWLEGSGYVDLEWASRLHDTILQSSAARRHRRDGLRVKGTC